MAFVIAEGVVEVDARINETDIRRDSRRAGTQAGDVFSSSFARSIIRGVDREFGGGRVSSRLIPGLGRRGAFVQLGGESGRGFMDGFARNLFTPNPALLSAMRTGVPAVLSSPAGVAGAAVAAIFIGSFVSAVLASGALAALGGGLIGLGALGVAASEEVTVAWERMTLRIRSGFRESASGMIPFFEKAITTIGDFFVKNLQPKLKTIFDDIAPAIQPLVDSLLKTADKFLGGISGSIKDLVPTLSKMSEQLPRLGEAAARFVNTLIDHGPEIARAFEGIVDITVNVIDALDDIIVVGTKVFNFFVDFGNMMKGIFGENPNPFGPYLKGLKAVTEGGPLDKFIDDHFRWSGALKEVNVEAESTPGAFSRIKDALIGFAGELNVGNLSMSEAIGLAGSLRNALDALSGGALAARAAEREFEAAIDSANEALAANGATLDISTAAGRANQDALDNIAESAIASASATHELTGSQEAAIGKLREGREALINAARQMGLNQSAAEALADEILGIPSRWETQFPNNAPSARDKVEGLRKKIFDIPFLRGTTFSSNADRIRAGVDALQRAIDRLSGKTVNIHTNYTSSGSPPRQGNSPGNFNRFGNVYMAQHGLVAMSRSMLFGSGGRTLFGFREPGTGGEAFIARNANRGRSLDILSTAAAWHQAMVVPMEQMRTSMRSLAVSTGARGGDGARMSPMGIGPINVTVNGLDPAQARRTGEEIADEIGDRLFNRLGKAVLARGGR